MGIVGGTFIGFQIQYCANACKLLRAEIASFPPSDARPITKEMRSIKTGFPYFRCSLLTFDANLAKIPKKRLVAKQESLVGSHLIKDLSSLVMDYADEDSSTRIEPYREVKFSQLLDRLQSDQLSHRKDLQKRLAASRQLLDKLA